MLMQLLKLCSAIFCALVILALYVTSGPYQYLLGCLGKTYVTSYSLTLAMQIAITILDFTVPESKIADLLQRRPSAWSVMSCTNLVIFFDMVLWAIALKSQHVPTILTVKLLMLAPILILIFVLLFRLKALWKRFDIVFSAIVLSLFVNAIYCSLEQFPSFGALYKGL